MRLRGKERKRDHVREREREGFCVKGRQSVSVYGGVKGGGLKRLRKTVDVTRIMFAGLLLAYSRVIKKYKRVK